MMKIIARLLCLLPRKREELSSAPQVSAPQAMEHKILPDGSVIFPIATNGKGQPIRFRPGVSYTVGSNGRWRKRRTPREKPQPEKLEVARLSKSRLPKTKKEIARETGSEYKHFNKYSSPLVMPPDYTVGKDRETRRVARVYRSMLASCYDPETYYYPAVGALGGTVVEDWRGSYHAFLAYMNSIGGFPKGESLRRLDDTKPFGPGNVKFVDPSSFAGGMISSTRKFSDKEIRQIRASSQSVTGLARIYSVSTGTISQIRSGKTYKGVT